MKYTLLVLAAAFLFGCGSTEATVPVAKINEKELIGTEWYVVGDSISRISFDSTVTQSQIDRWWADIMIPKGQGIAVKMESVYYKEASTRKYDIGFFSIYSGDSLTIFTRSQEYDFHYYGTIKQISPTILEFNGTANHPYGWFPDRKVKMVFVKK